MNAYILSKKGKRFSLGIFITILIGTLQFLSGCSPKVELDPEVQRMKDSVYVYSAINTAYLKYQQALKEFQDDQKSSAQKSFEQSVELISDVNSKILDNPRNTQWKNDYNEIGKSVVQDYLASQLDIDENSKVFKLADKFSVKYEKVNVFTNTDTEPLPSGSDLPLIKNSAVDEYIDFFSKTDRGRGFVDKTLYRSGKYFPLMRKILRFHKAPEELIYLSVVESGLSPTITSKAGAVGLWQFMPATGQAYGLYQDAYRDDRRDFEKSTDAASRHLKDLFRSFDDWYLAFASYNAGPGRITSAISKSGSKDFWSIRSYLPGETKNYVPSILAISFIFRNPEEYGFKNVEYAKQLTFDRINIKGHLSFDQIAKFSETDIETIRDLNPELLQDSLPNYDVPYQLRIPHDSFESFKSNYKKSLEYERNGENDPEYAGNEEGVYADEPIGSYYKVEDYSPGDAKYIVSTVNKKRIAYTFAPKDNLKMVADSFHVRQSDIRIWNNIPIGSYPKPNQEISIYISEKAYNQLYGIPENKPDSTNSKNTIPENKNTNKGEKVDSTKTEKQDNVKNKSNNNNTEKKKKKSEPSEKEQVYTVKEGDALSIIAGSFGVSVQDIKDWNNLKDDKILVGQKLKIYSDKKTDKTEKTETKNKKQNHTVLEGENLSLIAEKYGITVDDIMEWNDLENDIIKPGQVLIVSEPEKKVTKDKTKKNQTSNKSKTHKVEEGENLTTIAAKYGITVDNIMEWNDLDNDVIIPGQVLIVSEPDKKDTKEKSKKNDTAKKGKTYKVEEGDNLSSIAGKYGVSVDDIMEWNNLENDKIIIGQVLIVSNPGKTKETTSVNTKKIIYKVKEGDTLEKIANDYDVTIDNIKEWNSLKSDKIIIGQELKILAKDTKKKK